MKKYMEFNNDREENIQLILGLAMMLGVFLIFMGTYQSYQLLVYLFTDSICW